MEKYCDLHTHSHFSDGTLSPTQLLERARDAGLSAIVLSDHNSVEGLEEFVAAGENSPVEAVPGIEISADYQGKELHILALFVRPEYYAAVTELMRQGQRNKERSNELLVENLNRAGFCLDYGQIREKTHNGFVNRAHIAAAMTEKGYTASVQEAFATYLAPGRGYYVPPQRLDAFDAIRFIKSIGAVAVLAHPYLSMDADGVRGFLPRAVEAGLDAMEVRYPKYDAATAELARAVAEEFGLLPSGGSDFHGEVKPDIRLGVGKGDLRIPVQWLEQLRTSLKKNKKEKKR